MVPPLATHAATLSLTPPSPTRPLGGLLIVLRLSAAAITFLTRLKLSFFLSLRLQLDARANRRPRSYISTMPFSASTYSGREEGPWKGRVGILSSDSFVLNGYLVCAWVWGACIVEERLRRLELLLGGIIVGGGV